jgi:hypothetical protein
MRVMSVSVLDVKLLEFNVYPELWAPAGGGAVSFQFGRTN